MKPIKYKIINGVTHFFHNPSSYFEWRKRGFANGDSGFILVRREGLLTTYKGFGTIEAPCTTPRHVTMMHDELFDGKLSTDDELITPFDKDAGSNPSLTSCRYVLFDLTSVPL